MPVTQEKPKDRLRFVIHARRVARYVILPLLLAVFAAAASAQCPAPQSGTAIYPKLKALTYPLASDQYSVEYSLGGGTWTPAKVYISEYGGSNSSPYLSFSPYAKLKSDHPTSMSFVSIPAGSGTTVSLRVTKVSDPPFKHRDHVSIRPSAKGIIADLLNDGSVEINAKTGSNFKGEQFILWWDATEKRGGGMQGLAFFLDPLYDAPTGKVKTIGVPGGTTELLPADLADIASSNYAALDFEGTVAINISSTDAPGAQAFTVPAQITKIFLGPGAWLQGKLAFAPGSTGKVRIYGPGVLDASRFEYDLRHCDGASGFAAQGYPALTGLKADKSFGPLTDVYLDGIIISDNDFYATASLAYTAPVTGSTINNVKVIAWNGNNDGLEFGANATASNVFVRSGDDSLKMWGSNVSVTNATVWQNYNGGVVNLGWGANSPGDNGSIDGLYVVKTDWTTPTAEERTWNIKDTNTVVHQNNAVIASMMTPGASFGEPGPVSVYENIYVEDSPQVLFSLKIVPPRDNSNTESLNLMAKSVLRLDIENLVSPPSAVANSIGFDNLSGNYKFPTRCVTGAPGCQSFDDYMLTGKMTVSLKNVFILAGTTATALTSFNAGTLGKVKTNGDVDVEYNSIVKPPPPPFCKQYICQ